MKKLRITRGRATLTKYQKGIGRLFFSAISATIKLEAVPIRVPLAPIFAPKASAHHSTVMLVDPR